MKIYSHCEKRVQCKNNARLPGLGFSLGFREIWPPFYGETIAGFRLFYWWDYLLRILQYYDYTIQSSARELNACCGFQRQLLHVVIISVQVSLRAKVNKTLKDVIWKKLRKGLNIINITEPGCSGACKVSFMASERAAAAGSRFRRDTGTALGTAGPGAVCSDTHGLRSTPITLACIYLCKWFTCVHTYIIESVIYEPRALLGFISQFISRSKTVILFRKRPVLYKILILISVRYCSCLHTILIVHFGVMQGIVSVVERI